MKFIAWLLLAATASAAEPIKLPLDVGTLKTRDGKVYEGAKVTGSDAVGLKITHAGGLARVEYARLPKDLAAKFPRDREAAKEQLAREAKDEAAHDRAVDKAIVEKKTPGEKTPAGDADSDSSDTADTAVEAKPVLKGDPEVKIAALNGYISRLEDGIVKANNTVMDANAKASKYASTATTSVTRSNGYGDSTTRDVVNQTRLNRAAFQRKRAEREQQKIVEAQRLIEDAKSQVETLKSQMAE
ncbi:MAG: hypothetical protein EOP83_19785 [Verrucomicrobiaceae bacterium]|nr:MAG: hypothetical protein EOP83_19785 [Verrucomicrobiaceae bacterium]